MMHLITVPVDVIKTRMQSPVFVNKYRGLRSGLQTLWAEEGWAGFTRGWTPTLLGFSYYGLAVYPGESVRENLRCFQAQTGSVPGLVPPRACILSLKQGGSPFARRLCHFVPHESRLCNGVLLVLSSNPIKQGTKCSSGRSWRWQEKPMTPCTTCRSSLLQAFTYTRAIISAWPSVCKYVLTHKNMQAQHRLQSRVWACVRPRYPVDLAWAIFAAMHPLSCTPCMHSSARSAEIRAAC